MTRVWCKYFRGGWRHPKVNYYRYYNINDKPIFIKSLEKIKNMGFDKIICCHGHCPFVPADPTITASQAFYEHWMELIKWGEAQEEAAAKSTAVVSTST